MLCCSSSTEDNCVDEGCDDVVVMFPLFVNACGCTAVVLALLLPLVVKFLASPVLDCLVLPPVSLITDDIKEEGSMTDLTRDSALSLAALPVTGLLVALVAFFANAI